MGIFGGLFASALICSPVIVLTVVMHGSAAAWILLPVGAAWGTLAAWAGLRLAAPTVARKLPEILMAVSKG